MYATLLVVLLLPGLLFGPPLDPPVIDDGGSSIAAEQSMESPVIADRAPLVPEQQALPAPAQPTLLDELAAADVARAPQIEERAGPTGELTLLDRYGTDLRRDVVSDGAKTGRFAGAAALGPRPGRVLPAERASVRTCDTRCNHRPPSRALYLQRRRS